VQQPTLVLVQPPGVQHGRPQRPPQVSTGIVSGRNFLFSISFSNLPTPLSSRTFQDIVMNLIAVV